MCFKRADLLSLKNNISQKRHGHETRRVKRGQVRIPGPRTKAMTKMIMFTAISEWNKFPYLIIQETSKERENS